MAGEVRLLRAMDRVATPWKNGGGVTREVCRSAASGPDSAFDWRVSIAEVAQPGPFSRFPGYRRLIALIEGRGMELHAPSGQITALRLRTPHTFEGEDDVTGALPFGPVSDLNVIFRPAAFAASLRFSDQPERLKAAPGQIVILLNVQTAPVPCVAAAGPLALNQLDAVLLADAELTRATSGMCAVIELIEVSLPTRAHHE